MDSIRRTQPRKRMASVRTKAVSWHGEAARPHL